MSEEFATAHDVSGVPALSAVPRALVVAGKSEAGEAGARALAEAGFDVVSAASGAAALRHLQDGDVDLVVLDVMLPDVWGIDLIRKVRAAGHDVPLIVFGAGDSEAERVLSLELGADDYVSTPFSPRELVSRGRAILRRVRREPSGASPVRVLGRLRIDLTRHEVSLADEAIVVTASEFRVLALLSSSPGKVFSRRQIMEHLWAGPYFGDGHPVDTHVLNIRRKIEVDPAQPRRLLTVRGFGFRLVAPACEAVPATQPDETLI